MDKPDVKADNGTLSMEKPTDEDVEESTIGNQNEASTSPPEAKTENPQSAPQEFQFTSSRRNQSPPRSAQSEPRHSPSPVNNSLIPAGAIKTPPDSSDDDEERGRSIESLSALQEAIQQIPVNRQSIARPRRPRSNYGPPLVTHDNANPAIPSARYPNPQQNAQQEQWKDVTLQKIIETKRYGTDSSEYESSSEEEHIPRRPLRPPNPAGQQTMPPPRPQFGHGPIARETRGKAALSLPEVSSRRATEATSRSTGVYRGTQSARMAPSRSIGVYRGTQSARVASDYDTSRGRVIVENPRRATEATSRSTRVYRGTQSARMAPSRSIGVYRGTQSARPASDYDTSRGRVIVESPRISRRQSYQKVEKNYPNEPVVPSRRRRLALHEHVNDTTDGEIRLRVDASAPLSLSFDGEMEGRTLQIEPVEGGMADLIITPRRENGDDSSTRAYDGDAEGSKGLSEKPKKPLQRRGSVSSKPRATRRQIIVEPNQSRLRTSSSTNRPTIYYDPHEYESGYYMPGMPEPVYPTPPQERGPPPSMSAHYHSLPPQPYHHPLPPDTIANSLPTLPQQPRRMAWSEGSDRAHWYNPPIHVHQAPEPVAMHSSSNISIAQGTPAVQGRPTTGAGSPDSRTLPYQHRHQPSLMESAVQPPSSLPPTQVQPPPPVPSAPKPPAAEPRKSNLMSLLNDDQPEEPKRKKPIEQTIPSHTPTPQQQTSIAPPPPVSQALPPRRDPYVEATTQPPYGRIPYAQQPGVAQMPGRQVVDLTREQASAARAAREEWPRQYPSHSSTPQGPGVNSQHSSIPQPGYNERSAFLGNHRSMLSQHNHPHHNPSPPPLSAFHNSPHMHSRTPSLSGPPGQQPRHGMSASAASQHAQAPAGTSQILQPNPYAQVDPPNGGPPPQGPGSMRPSPHLHNIHPGGQRDVHGRNEHSQVHNSGLTYPNPQAPGEQHPVAQHGRAPSMADQFRRDPRDIHHDFDPRTGDRDMSREIQHRADALLREREPMMSRSVGPPPTRQDPRQDPRYQPQQDRVFSAQQRSHTPLSRSDHAPPPLQHPPRSSLGDGHPIYGGHPRPEERFRDPFARENNRLREEQAQREELYASHRDRERRERELHEMREREAHIQRERIMGRGPPQGPPGPDQRGTPGPPGPPQGPGGMDWTNAVSRQHGEWRR